ncbi:kelch-like protein 12 [Eurytemora carolleeae]|uniref:kelch-like protein 12 n=1 Tax=Eurytemora carolleeae TaxID=1294199 RepID=UPI000C7776F9|nr:kelch-like protein 12 [Eurytemora carolleeae]|eukprot:XP_023342324.1 kelch-like protein 12 [Eurytemora affinis]
MILSIVSILFAGYLASCSKGFVSAETTAVLLGGGYDGKTESYPCDVAIGDIGGLWGLGAAVLNGQIVYCGGNDLALCNCYKNEGMGWIEFASMNVARGYFTLTTLGDKILAAGGYDSQERTATVEVFDGSSWKLQNYELTSARSSHCAVPIGVSQVMLLGGESVYNYLSLVEVYSIEEGFIAELPSMPTAR